MQSQLHKNPSILPLHEIREGLELVVVARELSVATGFIDLIALDAAGDIYIIETKLVRNPDRRTVVAQALDYGAALWTEYPDATRFIAAIDELLARNGAKRVADLLDVAVGGDEDAVMQIMDRITKNLRDGSFRFVIPMDRIEDSLKDLVRYVNENSRFTIFLVELEQYQSDGLTVIVPHLFGAESRKSGDVGPSRSRGRPGNDTEFLADIDHRVAAGLLDEAIARALRSLVLVMTQYGSDNYWLIGVGGRVNVSPKFPQTGAVRSPFTLRSDGELQFNFPYISEVTAWADWVSRVRSEFGLEGDPRGHPTLKPAVWVPKANILTTMTAEVVK